MDPTRRTSAPATAATATTLRPQARRELLTIGKFGLGSLAGVTVDLAVFQLLQFLLLSPFISNAISSFAAICVTYSLVTRYAYNVDGAPRAFFAFASWYAISITAFSALIGWLALTTGMLPLSLKILSLPFSFGVNYLFTRLLFTRLLAAEKTRRNAPKLWLFSPDSRRQDRAILLLAVLAAATTAVLLMYRHPVQNSDTLFLEDLSHDLFVNSGRWSDWRLTPAPAFMPDMLLYFLGYKLLPTISARVAFVTVSQWAILGVTVVWFVKVVSPKIRTLSLSLVVATYAAFTFVVARTGIWVFFDSANNHFAALWLPIVSVAIGVPYLSGRGGRLRLTLLALVAFLGQVSTDIFALGFALPLVFAAGPAFLVLKGPTFSRSRRRLVAITLAVGTGTALALAASKVIIFNAPMDNRTSFTDARILASVEQFIRATLFALRSGDALITLFSLSVIACALYLFAKAISSTFISTRPSEHGGEGKDDDVDFQIGATGSNWRLLAVTWLALCSLAVATSASIISGGFSDRFGYRYFSFGIALVTLGAIATWLGQRSTTLPSLRLFTTLIAIAAIAATARSTSWVSGVADARAHAPNRQIAICLDNLKSKGVPLSAGIADYWDARGVTYLTADLTPILPVFPDLLPFYWMSTSGPLVRPQAYPTRTYNFAIFTDSEWALFGSGRNFVASELPPPTQKYQCAGGAEVWTWNDSALNTLIQGNVQRWAFSQWATGKGDPESTSVDMDASAFPSQTGILDGTSRSASPGADSGFLLYGPYAALRPGKYAVRIDYAWTGATGDSAHSTWEAGQFFDPTSPLTLASGTFSASDTSVTGTFIVPSGGLTAFETRVRYGGGGTLSVSSIRFERLPDK